jgi:hypothetical protein
MAVVFATAKVVSADDVVTTLPQTVDNQSGDALVSKE